MQFIESSDFVGDAVSIITSSLSGPSDSLYRMSLCGGSTPEPVYEALSESQLNWSNIEITFGDERSVPPDHEDSNYRMASRSFLDKVPLNKNVPIYASKIPMTTVTPKNKRFLFLCKNVRFPK